MTARVATVTAPAVVLAALAWSSGGYFPRTWGWLLLADAVAVGAWALVATRLAATRAGVTIVAALLILAAWQLLSRAWSVAPDAAPLEAERTLAYAGAALAALLLVSRSRTPELVAGVLLGTTAVTVGGLATHLVEGMPEGRLVEPIGYANAAGITATTALVLGLGLALHGPRRRRVLAGLATVPAGTALLLSLSRGSLVALGAGLLVLVLLRRARRTPHDGAARAATTVGAAVGVVVVLAAVTLYELTTRSTPAPQRGMPAQGGTPGRLLSTSTSDRANYWEVAAGMVAREPLHGEGAGSYERVWLRERPVPMPARDAHNLYLEALAELGPVGLAALLVALGAPLAAARRSVGTPHGTAAAAAYVALLVHAGLDWDWELPAVMLAVILLGLALASADEREPSSKPLRALPRAVALAAAAAVAAIALVVHLGNGAVADAHRALDRSDPAAARSAALRARRFVPWAAEPWQLLGEADLLAGRVARGREELRRATRRDPGAWTAWLALAFATGGEARAEALARAQALNPLAPELELAARSP